MSSQSDISQEPQTSLTCTGLLYGHQIQYRNFVLSLSLLALGLYLISHAASYTIYNLANVQRKRSSNQLYIDKEKRRSMAKCRTNGKKKNGMVMLKIVVERLQKSLLLGRKNSSDLDEFDEDTRESKNLPNDVKEGHFAVIAVDDDELKRFIVPLSYLTHPSFLRLLEQAAEEYGFDHEGALTIPCRPSELEHILKEQWVEQRDSRFLVNWPAS